MKRTAVVFAIILAAWTGAASAYTPLFTWEVRGDVNYRMCILDHGEEIAHLSTGTADEPLQALMFFSAVPRPVMLRDLKFAPGGRPLVSAVQLFWKNTTIGATTVLRGIDVNGQGTGTLALAFELTDEGGRATLVRTLTVTWDEARGTYVYDFQDEAQLADPETFVTAGVHSIEICDPWFTACPAPSRLFEGMWQGRYRQFAYEAADSRLLAIPHNHAATSLKQARVRPDGVYAAVFEPDGNPAIQLVGETGRNSSIGVCPWGYDVHVSLAIDPAAAHDTLRARFRFFMLPVDTARDWDRRAVVPALKSGEFGGMSVVPLYEPDGSFENGLAIDKPRGGDIDPWFWTPLDEKGAVWDNTTARSGSRSLKIDKDTPGVATWYSMCEGQGYWAEPWLPCKGYDITCWVRTENLTGQGASISAQYHVPNIPPDWPPVRSERIAGDNGWTKLTLRLGPPPPDTSIVSIYLQQAGPGTTWFDDLIVTMLK